MLTHRKSSRLFAPLVIAALLAIAIAGAAPAVVGPSASAAATTWYVKPTGLDTNTCKTPALACKTINGALAKALGGDTIRVAIGTYTAIYGTEVVLVNKTVALLGGWNAAFTAQTGMSTIDGQNVRGGIRKPLSTATLTVARFQIRNGRSTVSAGGGIGSLGPLLVTNSILTGNSPAGIGGGNGNLAVANSTISNSANGGIRWSGNFAVTVNKSTLDENNTVGIFFNGASGSVTVNNSTISNSVGDGLKITGTLTLNNSTVSGTTLGTTLLGVGVSVAGTMNLNNATVTDNLLGVELVSGTATLTNSIVADNSNDGGTTPNDCAGTIGSGGYNVIGSADSCTFTSSTGDQVGSNVSAIDPLLGPLSLHGGTTPTHQLLALSPGIDHGNPATPGSGSGACLATDQRGMSRQLAAAGTCDSGAYESFALGVVTITRLEANPTAAGTLRFNVLFSDLVTGVDPSDFIVTSDGTIAGASVPLTGVAGSGNVYTVTVNSGTGEGNVRLDLTADGSIKDPNLNPVSTNFTGGDAYAVANPLVLSVNRVGAALTSAQTFSYKVNFSVPVIGVDKTDFKLTAAGLTGAAVTSVTGAGMAYTVTVNRGTGSGTLRLDVIDNDTIAGPASGRPLGGAGLGNGNFTTGQFYTVVPMPAAPGAGTWDNTPTYTWIKLAGVTQYQIQVLRGTTVVYSPIIAATSCGATTCSFTPGPILIPAAYTWKVRALSAGLWRDFSPTKTFWVIGAEAGSWGNTNSLLTFRVAANHTQITQFTFWSFICGGWWNFTYTPGVPVAINAGKFSFSHTFPGTISSLSASGAFAANAPFSTKASGTSTSKNFLYGSCGLHSVSGTWNNIWISAFQPPTSPLQGAEPLHPQPFYNMLP